MRQVMGRAELARPPARPPLHPAGVAGVSALRQVLFKAQSRADKALTLSEPLGPCRKKKEIENLVSC